MAQVPLPPQILVDQANPDHMNTMASLRSPPSLVQNHMGRVSVASFLRNTYYETKYASLKKIYSWGQNKVFDLWKMN